MRYHEFKSIVEHSLAEIKQNPGALQKWAASGPGEKMLAGFEAELIFSGLRSPIYIDSDDFVMPGSGEKDVNDRTLQTLADELSGVLGVKTAVSPGYHLTKRDSETWIFEPDSSIEPNDSEERDLAIEIVSPPMALNQAVKIMPRFFAWAKKRGAYANESTGFHMSVSMPDHSAASLDYAKLALLMGDQYVLEQFGRVANDFAESAVEKIQNKSRRLTPKLVQEMFDTMRKNLSSEATKYIAVSGGFGKYISIHPKQKYVEFRSAGGVDYFNNIEKIQNTLLRYARALSAAMDPDAERREYAKKLYKLITGTETRTVQDPKTGRHRTEVNPQGSKTDTLWVFSLYAAGRLSKSQLAEFVKSISQTRSQERDIQSRIKKLPPSNPRGNYAIVHYHNDNRKMVYQFQAYDDRSAWRIADAWFDNHPELTWNVDRYADPEHFRGNYALVDLSRGDGTVFAVSRPADM